MCFYEQKFSIGILNHVKREKILIKVWYFHYLSVGVLQMNKMQLLGFKDKAEIIVSSKNQRYSLHIFHSLWFKLNSFFSLFLFPTGFHKNTKKIYLLCYQGHFKENYWLCQKYGSDANSRVWKGHDIFVVITEYVRKSVCDSTIKLFDYSYLS